MASTSKIKSYLYSLLFNFLGKPLNLLFSIAIAYYFGTTKAIDVYFWSIVFVNIYYSYTFGNWAQAIIPIYIKLKITQPEELKSFVTLLQSWYFVLSLLFSIILYLFAYLFVAKFTSFDFQEKQYAIQMLQLSLPYYLFYSLYSFNVNLNNANMSFRLNSFLDNIVRILVVMGVLLLCNRQLGVMSLVAANNIAQAIIWLVLISIYIKKNSGSFKFILVLRKKYVREFIDLLYPYYILQMFDSVSNLFSKYILSGLSIGSLAFINYAEQIIAAVLGPMATNLSAIMFSEYSHIANSDNSDVLRQTYLRSVINIWLLIIPTSYFIIFFGNYIISLLFQRGNFDAISTQGTTLTLQCLAIGLFASSAHMFTCRLFSALEDVKVGYVTALPTTIVALASNYYLPKLLGFAGVALATSVSTIFSFVLLMIMLHIRHFKLDFISLFINFIKINIACCLPSLLIIGITKYLGFTVINNSVCNTIIYLMGAGVAFSLVFFVMAYILSIEEFIAITKWLRTKMFIACKRYSET